MKPLIAILILSFCFSTFSYGQIEAPRASPLGSVSQTIGLTEVSISYSRPGVKDRVIFGELLPFGELWRTGANKATTISFSDTVSIKGTRVAPGDYAIFSIPREKSWTLIFNSNADQGGTRNYDKSLDVLRLEVAPLMLNDKVETLTFTFDEVTMTTAKVSLRWETTEVSFPIEVEVDSKMEAQIKSALDPANQWSNYFTSARYYMHAGKDLNQALEWVNKSIELKGDMYFVYNLKAEILLAMGKKNEALATADKALKMNAGYQAQYNVIKQKAGK